MMLKKTLGITSLFFLLIAFVACNETTSDNDGNAEHSEHEHKGMDDEHVEGKGTED